MPLSFFLAQQHPGAPGQQARGNPEIDPMAAGSHANNAAALWSLGIVIVLILVLWKLAWGPITRALASREDRINDSLKRAEALEKATRELAETNRKAMEKAQLEAQAIVAESRVAAKKAAADVTAKLEAELAASRERFRKEMELEAGKVRSELRAEVVELTLLTASQMIGRHLSGPDQVRLVEESLRDAESVVRN